MKCVEILAPAGSYEAMLSAVSGGCDAVYAAGEKYGARAFAKNFSEEELIKALDYLHLRGKSLYLTMNTLMKENEVYAAVKSLKILYEEGLDGVIVQDIGLMGLIHEEYPDLPLHASTQLSVSSGYGAGFLENLGVSRIVPARECSLSDIKMLREDTDMEIECFVHGALCFCYSGHCLFSSMNGGRSGNRGRCAQPCRMPYFYEGSQKAYILSPKDICTLSVIPDLIEAGIDSFKIEGRMKNPEYCALTSFLYKKYSLAYYEYGRAYYEESFINESGKRHGEFLKDIQDAMDIFNRGGFSTGYYFNHNGKEMMSEKRQNHYGSPVGMVYSASGGKNDKFQILIHPYSDIRKDDVLEIRDKEDNTLLLINGSKDFKKDEKAAFSPYGLSGEKRGKIIRALNREKKLKLYRLRNHRLISDINSFPAPKEVNVMARLSGGKGEHLRLGLETKGFKAEVISSQLLSAAEHEKFSQEKLSKQLNKTGDYPFNIELDTEGLSKDCFIPMSLFNGLRREAVDALGNEIIMSCKRKCRQDIKRDYVFSETKGPCREKPVIICSVISEEQAEEVIRLSAANPEIEFEMIINGAACSFEMFSDIIGHKADTLKVYFGLPYIFQVKGAGSCWEKFKGLIGSSLGVYVRTLDEAGFIKENYPDMEIRLDSGVYQWNRPSQDIYRKNGIIYHTLSPELKGDELKELSLSNAILPVYGCQNLMVSAQCPVKNANKKCPGQAFYGFKNEEGREFFGINVCSYCYNLIFESTPKNLMNQMDFIMGMGLYGLRLDFYREDAKALSETVLAFIRMLDKFEKTADNARFYEGRFLKGID